MANAVQVSAETVGTEVLFESWQESVFDGMTGSEAPQGVGGSALVVWLAVRIGIRL